MFRRAIKLLDSSIHCDFKTKTNVFKSWFGPHSKISILEIISNAEAYIIFI